MPDLLTAQENGGAGSYTGRWDGQKIMAITVLSSFPARSFWGCDMLFRCRRLTVSLP